MEVVSKILRMRAVVDDLRRGGRKVGFVPTMGALHEGHLSLARLVRERGAECIFSVFVNPTQFAPDEDFERYPRDLTRDCELLTREGVAAVFAPSPEEMHPPDFTTHVQVDELSDILTGAHRPGHFRGVATIVLKLLNIVEPDFAVFGWKDAQQLIILKQMARDLNLAVEIVGAPTLREADGVAASSRNVLLDEIGRRSARALYRALQEAVRLVDAGERSPQVVEDAAKAILRADERIEIDYVEAVSADDLGKQKRLSGAILVLISVKVKMDGRPAVLLIDNVQIDVPEDAAAPRRPGA